MFRYLFSHQRFCHLIDRPQTTPDLAAGSAMAMLMPLFAPSRPPHACHRRDFLLSPRAQTGLDLGSKPTPCPPETAAIFYRRRSSKPCPRPRHVRRDVASTEEQKSNVEPVLPVSTTRRRQDRPFCKHARSTGLRQASTQKQSWTPCPIHSPGTMPKPLPLPENLFPLPHGLGLNLGANPSGDSSQSLGPCGRGIGRRPSLVLTD